jgi:hypothetical protein
METVLVNFTRRSLTIGGMSLLAGASKSQLNRCYLRAISHRSENTPVITSN